MGWWVDKLIGWEVDWFIGLLVDRFINLRGRLVTPYWRLKTDHERPATWKSGQFNYLAWIAGFLRSWKPYHWNEYCRLETADCHGVRISSFGVFHWFFIWTVSDISRMPVFITGISPGIELMISTFQSMVLPLLSRAFDEATPPLWISILLRVISTPGLVLNTGLDEVVWITTFSLPEWKIERFLSKMMVSETRKIESINSAMYM